MRVSLANWFVDFYLTFGLTGALFKNAVEINILYS